jgi:miniconductance mechanosensitive channel
MNYYAWLENPYVKTVAGFLALVIFILILQKIIKFLYIKMLNNFFSKSERRISAFFKDTKLVFWLGLVPAPIIFYYGILSLPYLVDWLASGFIRINFCIALFISLRILSHFLRVLDNLYQRSEASKSRPIKGYLQGISLTAHFIGIISIIAILMDRSPLVLLSGLGAATAILLLIFRDSILSLVAGIQVTMNDLIRVGDWIEVPQFNADGAVIEIALHTVKVQNWDKTITVIPAHKFLENSFKNWRGMQESGGRRIKRSIFIDVKSIRFLTNEDIDKFRKIKLIREYIDQKVTEITEYNNTTCDDEARIYSPNIRRLTNVGTFRHYLSAYLKNNPYIHKEHTFLVRQLEPKSEGLPIEIYVFTNDTRWAIYEDIQANIFDHVLAIMPEFDLRFYQKPSGHDLSSLKI